MLLSTTNLIADRNGRALFAPLSLDVSAGDTVRIHGANGTGKSTLLRVLAGLRPAFSGTLTRDPSFAYLGHKNAIEDKLTVREQLAFWCGSAPAPALFEKLTLADVADKRIAELSQGMKRRVALTYLFTRNAKLWLLDEPHAALDAATVFLLQKHIEAHGAKGGAVILASHGGLETVSEKAVELMPAHEERAP